MVEFQNQRQGIGVTDDIQNNLDDEGLQEVNSRLKEKAQKKKTARSNYTTKSRPGSAQNSP